jgi:hypothetical protein
VRFLHDLTSVPADQLMPDLLGMLSTPMDKDHRMLKAVGIECTAFIGLAAGKQVCFRCLKWGRSRVAEVAL